MPPATRRERTAGQRSTASASCARPWSLRTSCGIDSVTMRVLGRRLGVEAASLYNHVAGKGDLLDGMVEVVAAEIDVPSRRRRTGRRRCAAGRSPRGRCSRATAGPRPSSTPADRERVRRAVLRGQGPRHAASGGVPPAGRRVRVPRARQLHPGVRAAAVRSLLADEPDASAGARETLAAVPPGAYPSLVRVAAGLRRGALRRGGGLRLRPGPAPRRSPALPRATLSRAAWRTG